MPGKLFATDMGIDTQKHLKANWRRQLKQRNNIYFSKAKRVCLLTDDALFHAMNSYLTHHRASGHFWGVEKVFSLDECPLSLDGEITRYVVLRGDKGEAITNVPASDAKRFCTYLPIVGVTLAGDTVSLRPVVISKGEGKLSAVEKRLYDDRVFVLFQKKGVTDEKVMVQAFQSWFPANASPVAIVQDAARQHWTELVKAELAARKLVGTRVPEGLTTYVQWLDCFWFMRFKVHYRKLYNTTIYGNQRKLSAAEKRVAVTLLVAEAHEKTMADVARTMFETFKSFGLIYNSHTRDFKFFTAPTFRYEMVDAVMEQFKKDMIAAAKPAARPRPKPKPKAAPKQMPITSFLR